MPLDPVADPAVQARSPRTPRVRVVSKHGEAISGAVVTWTPLLPSWSEKACAWLNPDWAYLEEQAVETVTDADGRFELPEIHVDPSATGSVLWISHPDYIARSVFLEFPIIPLHLPDTISLQDGPHLHARVLHADGRPAPGATVFQTVDLSEVEIDHEPGLHLQAQRALRRTYRAEADGFARLGPFPGANRVWADSGGLRSQPWTGAGPAEFVLELRPTFTAGGRVSVPEGFEMPRNTAVRSSVRRGARSSVVEHHLVRADGIWGPDWLPALEGDEFVFRLESDAFIKEEVAVAPPVGGSQITVDFIAEPGIGARVHVVGPKDEELGAAVVVARWHRKDIWHSTRAFADASGWAHLNGLPQGVAYISATCPGYVEGGINPIELVASGQEPITVRLDRAGSIRGRCLHGEEPVQDFDLVWWSDFDIRRSKQEVRNSSDGAFLITEAPLGRVMLTAFSDDLPQAEAQTVTVEADSTAVVVIRLPSPLKGRGMVVDALTGEPLADARVHLLTHHQGKKIDQHGAAWNVDLGGIFEITGLAAGGNMIEVSAPGHSTRLAKGTGVPGNVIDFGRVPLYEKQALEVRLVSESEAEFSGFAAELQGATHIADRRFSSDGALRYASLDPGLYTLRVVYPGGTSYLDMPFVLDPGRDKILEVRITADTLIVEVVPEDGEEVPENLLLFVMYESNAGKNTCQYYGVPKSGRVEIRRVDGPIAIQVQTFYEEEIVAVARAIVEPGSSPTIRVPLGTAPADFRIVDQNLRPLPGIRVSVNCTGDCGGWYVVRETDRDGLCTFTGIALDEALVLLSKYPGGAVPGRTISLRERPNGPIQMVFAPDSTLRVMLAERGARARGVDISAKDPDGVMLLSARASDDQGIVDFGPVGAGAWRVYVEHPGYWRQESIAKVDAASGPIPVEVRRLGNVEFEAKTPYGNPASGLPIDLHCEEMDEWASVWIHEGRVPSPASGLLTDASGRLRVNALPNGHFRWRATTPGGEAIEGEVGIPPHGTALVSVTTP